jgi:Mn-containing catalase
MIYERLINTTDDPGVAEALGFLMTREVAHQKAFEKALYSIEPNFPPGKLPGMPEFRNKYFNLSVGDGDMRGPWNQGEQWEFVDGEQAMTNADPGGDGTFSVQMTPDQQELGDKAKERLMSDLDSDPTTGADLGAGPGAGAITGESAQRDDELPENPVGAQRKGNAGTARTTRTRR